MLEEFAQSRFDREPGFLARSEQDEVAVPRPLAYASELKPQERKGLSPYSVHHFGLLRVHLHAQAAKVFAEPLQGPRGPAPFRVVATDGDNDIISEPMIIHGLIGSLGRLAADRVKGPVHLIQVDIGCQRAERPPLRDTDLASGFQDLLHEMEHGGVLHAPGNLLQEEVMSNRVEVAS